jgi:hypothetical protein
MSVDRVLALAHEFNGGFRIDLVEGEALVRGLRIPVVQVFPQFVKSRPHPIQMFGIFGGQISFWVVVSKLAFAFMFHIPSVLVVVSCARIWRLSLPEPALHPAL